MSSVPNQVYVNQDTANQVIVNQDSQNLVTVRSGGLGSGGGNTRRFVFTQGQASSTWTINHTLGGKPSVTVVDSANTVVFGEVQYVSNSQVVVVFSAPFSGFAFLT